MRKYYPRLGNIYLDESKFPECPKDAWQDIAWLLANHLVQVENKLEGPDPRLTMIKLQSTVAIVKRARQQARDMQKQRYDDEQSRKQTEAWKARQQKRWAAEEGVERPVDGAFDSTEGRQA